MLELIDLDRKISKTTYERTFPDLEARLGQCQRAARIANVPVVIVFEGWDAAGKGTTINRVTQALDPRGFKVHPTVAATEVEQMRPWMWRFWNILPAAGNFAVFDRSWYGRVLRDRVEDSVPEDQWRQAFEEIEQFERQLTDAGVVLVKFWLHISRGEQRRRFERLQEDPATAWRVGKPERRQNKRYKRWLAAVEEMLQRTDRPHAPWTVVEATQERFVRVKVFETILRAAEAELRRRCKTPKPVGPAVPADAPTGRDTAGKAATGQDTAGKAATGRDTAGKAGPTDPGTDLSDRPTILDRVDLTRSLTRAEYDVELAAHQDSLFQLEHRLYTARVPAVVAFEGWDAAGKGGAIRRLTQGLDPRGYEVIPIGAPTAEDLAHHYLWRFWRQIPKAGHIAIFDRTWYGRVLVERVEGLCTEEEWKRAFTEINEFEHQLVEFGTAIVKFWLHIDRSEQLRRFQERQVNPYKEWKITDEDWRNREKWDRYAAAVVEMLERTSTTYAPWTILEANCKFFARVKVLRTVADALERGLE